MKTKRKIIDVTLEDVLEVLKQARHAYVTDLQITIISEDGSILTVYHNAGSSLHTLEVEKAQDYVDYVGTKIKYKPQRRHDFV